MNIITVVPPPFEPVTLEEAYAHLRWDTEDEGSPSETVYPLGALVMRNIVTARQYVEEHTRRALVKQTLRRAIPSFPRGTPLRYGRWDHADCWDSRPGYVELLRPPTLEMESVQYLDENEVLQTLDPSNYYVDRDSDIVARLYFRDTFNMDVAHANRADAVRITWTAGYPLGTDSPSETQANYAANVPSGIKDAILIQVQLLVDRFDSKERDDLEKARDRLLFSKQVARY